LALGTTIWSFIAAFSLSEEAVTAVAAIQYALPVFCGFLVTWSSRRRKLILAATIGITSAVAVSVANAVFEAVGHRVDFYGISGGLLLFGFSLIYCFPAAIVGWCLANFVSWVSRTTR
jgi:hypothetical protein